MAEQTKERERRPVDDADPETRDDRRAYAKANPTCELSDMLDDFRPTGWPEYRRVWSGHEDEHTTDTHHIHGRGFAACHRTWNIIRVSRPAHDFCTGESFGRDDGTKGRDGTSRWGRLVCVWAKFVKGEYDPQAARKWTRKDQIGDISNDYRNDIFGASPPLVVLAEKLLALNGRLCAYCGEDTRLIPEGEFGAYWSCDPCGATVGCRRNTHQALGRTADAELRGLRMRAHAAFDPLWADDKELRSKAYRWLSVRMGLPLGLTHFGMFDADQCRKAIRICEAETRCELDVTA